MEQESLFKNRRSAKHTMHDKIDHKKEREKDTKIILDSKSPKRVVVAGPGTGKSFLFEQIIKKLNDDGKDNVLAITFIGKLTDFLADDLAGLAIVKTLHGFAREFVLGFKNDWEYIPNISAIIKEDLKIAGIVDASVGSDAYRERSNYYKAVGDEDVVYYANKICKEKSSAIPIFDTILIDEFQDFSELEDEFIETLSSKNKIVIVGDDDQALYGFRGSSPKFIRNKHDDSNKDYESLSLKYCSRCTDVIIKSFHNIIGHFDLDEIGSDRVKKEYICYFPEKEDDNKNNPSIVVLKDVLPGAIASRVSNELRTILNKQKIKSVLIVGEARSCKSMLSSTGVILKRYGFNNVSSKYEDNTYTFKKDVVAGLKIVNKNEDSIAGWRVLIKELSSKSRASVIIDNYSDQSKFVESIPLEFRKNWIKLSKTYINVISNKKVSVPSLANLQDKIIDHKISEEELFTKELISEYSYLPRPLANLEITITNILGSKGLGADVVFLLGFDNGRLPVKQRDIKESEIYQMLVALTRAKKRIYLINTIDKQVSEFIECINEDNYDVIIQKTRK